MSAIKIFYIRYNNKMPNKILIPTLLQEDILVSSVEQKHLVQINDQINKPHNYGKIMGIPFGFYDFSSKSSEYNKTIFILDLQDSNLFYHQFSKVSYTDDPEFQDIKIDWEEKENDYVAKIYLDVQYVNNALNASKIVYI